MGKLKFKRKEKSIVYSYKNVLFQLKWILWKELINFNEIKVEIDTLAWEQKLELMTSCWNSNLSPEPLTFGLDARKSCFSVIVTL